MDEIHKLLLQRNAIETTPFLSIHASNAALQNLADGLRYRCAALEADREERDEEEKKRERDGNQQQQHSNKDKNASSKVEIKLRNKVEKLQEQLNEKLRNEVESSATALKTAQQLSSQKDTITSQRSSLQSLQTQTNTQQQTITQLQESLQDAESRSQLAERQYDGLKDTIRTLQEENDHLTKDNVELVNRVVTEKEKLLEQIRELTEGMERMKKEVEMLRALNEQEEKRSWWKKRGGGGGGNNGSGEEEDGSLSKGPLGSRRFGGIGVVPPSSLKQKVQAHPSQATCVRYDATGSDLLATASDDSTVRIWDTGAGHLRTTLRGGSANVMLGLDFSGAFAAACGTDKTCRVWNTRTSRMVHQLTGHSHKVTCVKLLQNEKSILTGSADRSLKLWDISRSTYRQTITLRHSSTSNCIDASDTSTAAAVSGHLDGGIRFWDLRTGDRTDDVSNLHLGGVACVRFHPVNSAEVVTLGRDSVVRILDVRTRGEIRAFRHGDFRVDSNYSSCAISPDGCYVSAGSGTTGDVFVWKTADGSLETTLKGHDVGTVGVAWGRGGSNGQQVSSVDKNGVLILWA